MLQAERGWVQRAAWQLLMSKVVRAWLQHVREIRRQKALSVAAGCHRSDVLLEHAWLGWKSSLCTGTAVTHCTVASGDHSQAAPINVSDTGPDQ